MLLDSDGSKPVLDARGSSALQNRLACRRPDVIRAGRSFVWFRKAGIVRVVFPNARGDVGQHLAWPDRGKLIDIADDKEGGLFRDATTANPPRWPSLTSNV
jgi:hypothetical protein